MARHQHMRPAKGEKLNELTESGRSHSLHPTKGYRSRKVLHDGPKAGAPAILVWVWNTALRKGVVL